MTIFLIVILIIASIIDIQKKIIPDWITAPGVILGCLITHSIIGALIGFFCVYIYNTVARNTFFKRTGFAGGDAKLMAAVGAFLGWQIAIIVFIISLGLYYSIKSILYLKRPIAYAPFIAAATFINLWLIEILYLKI